MSMWYSFWQASMDLPPDKAKVLKAYDDDKKWELICDQDMVSAKQPPQYYINKMKVYLDPKAGKSSKVSEMESKQKEDDLWSNLPLPQVSGSLFVDIYLVPETTHVGRFNIDSDTARLGNFLEDKSHRVSNYICRLWKQGLLLNNLSEHTSQWMVFFSTCCRWVRSFLGEEHMGLDVLVEYLSYTQIVMR